MRASRPIRVVASAALLLSSAACGTRVGRNEATSSQLPVGAATTIESAPLRADGLAGRPANPPPGGLTAPASAQAVSRGGQPSTPVRTDPATGAKAASSVVGTSLPVAREGQTRPDEKSLPGAEGPTPVPAAVPSPGSPAVIASVGTLSGPAGSVLLPMTEGVQVWVRYINDRGGVNGHPVRLLTYDDGGDPARHRAQIQEAVERQHVIAFVQTNGVLTGRGSIDYISAHRIPVIGSETGSAWFYENPMYFPQASSGDLFFELNILGVGQQAAPLGKAKFGWIYCAEINACTEFDRVAAATAQEAGLQPVYRAKASLAQPDFTAECISARNAGVEILDVALDTNSIGRVAASCARQGFRPIFSSLGGLIADRLKDDVNMAGFVGSINVFPYFQRGTPATDEFQHAMKAYGGKTATAPGVAPTVGWVSAKLFEKAAANLSEPPTAQSVLEGLWGIRNDTLGGLTADLTFTKDQPAPRVLCWWNVAVKASAWISPDGFKAHCR